MSGSVSADTNNETVICLLLFDLIPLNTQTYLAGRVSSGERRGGLAALRGLGGLDGKRSLICYSFTIETKDRTREGKAISREASLGRNGFNVYAGMGKGRSLEWGLKD